MARSTRGSTYAEPRGTVGIRWPENGKRPQRGGFKNKTEARDWFEKHVAPRLRRGGPSADITFEAFCVEHLARWEPGVAKRTRLTLREWLTPAREHFGRWTLSELEGAADDIARWHARAPSDYARYTRTRALRQVLAAARRWGYIASNPALDFGKNHEPRRVEVWPFTHDEIDALDAELGTISGPLVIFAAETGLRTNEWVAIERRDIDRRNPAVIVQRRTTDGELTPYPKTQRRRVPLTPRALDALDRLPAQLKTPLLFPAPKGGYIDLDNWRLREWYPALDAAGISRRGPYQLRHTFATEALAAGVSIFQLSRLMGASVKTIDKHYGHLAHDSDEHLRGLLAARSGVLVASRSGGES